MNYNSETIVSGSFARVDCHKDSFSVIRCIQSDLLYGNPTAIKFPWITVLIPTFNRTAFLQEAIQSALIQDGADFPWEIVIVDNTPLGPNGSTPTLELVRCYDEPRILYFHNQANIGPGYNWNRGFELSRGEWIVMLHDDDILFPDALKNIGRQIRTFKGKKPLGYLHARRVDFSDALPEAPKRWFPPERLCRFGVLISGCTGAGAPTCGTAILKKAYLETGGINYDFGPSADAVLCYQIMKDYAVICSDHILGGYRWDCNATLNKNALLMTIRADELLSAYTYALSPFARLWGKVFGAASSWRNIWRKQNIAKRYGVEVTAEEFASSTVFTEPGLLKKRIFLGIYAFYRVMRYIYVLLHR